MRVACIFLLFVLHVNHCIAQHRSGSIYSLKQSLELALANNLEIKKAEFEAAEAAVQLKQSKADLLPGIAANINHGLNQGRSIDPFSNTYVNQNINFANYSLSSGIVLFNGLLIKNEIQQNRFRYEAGKMAQQQAKDQLTLHVIYTYYQILSQEDQVAQARLQVDATAKQVQRLLILNKQGAIAPALLSDMTGQLASDELALINSTNNLNASKIELARLMNVPYDLNMNVERIALPDSEASESSSADKIYAQALEQLALVKAAALRKEEARKGIQVAQAGRYPQLSLNGSLFSNYSSAAFSSRLIAVDNQPGAEYVELNGSKLPVVTENRKYESTRIAYNNQLKNNYSSSVAVALRIPIFNASAVKSRVALAKIELKRVQAIEETTRLQLKQAVDQAWFNMASARERLDVFKRQVTSYRESFRAAEVRFKAGAGTVVDYIIAKNNLDRSSMSLINARYDYVLRLKVLKYYQGKSII